MGTGVVLGGVLIFISLLTDYPLGVIRVIPFVVHSAGDYLGAATLIAAPFVLGFTDSDSGLAAFYVAIGVTLVAVSLITDYSDPVPAGPPSNGPFTVKRWRLFYGLTASCPTWDLLGVR